MNTRFECCPLLFSTDSTVYRKTIVDRSTQTHAKVYSGIQLRLVENKTIGFLVTIQQIITIIIISDSYTSNTWYPSNIF
jgi:hypothetical protein